MLFEGTTCDGREGFPVGVKRIRLAIPKRRCMNGNLGICRTPKRDRRDLGWRLANLHQLANA